MYGFVIVFKNSLLDLIDEQLILHNWWCIVCLNNDCYFAHGALVNCVGIALTSIVGGLILAYSLSAAF